MRVQIVKLSNGVEIGLFERGGGLDIAMMEEGSIAKLREFRCGAEVALDDLDALAGNLVYSNVATIQTSGVLVMPNSGEACGLIASGLVRETCGQAIRRYACFSKLHYSKRPWSSVGVNTPAGQCICNLFERYKTHTEFLLEEGDHCAVLSNWWTHIEDAFDAQLCKEADDGF